MAPDLIVCAYCRLKWYLLDIGCWTSSKYATGEADDVGLSKIEAQNCHKYLNKGLNRPRMKDYLYNLFTRRGCTDEQEQDYQKTD